MLCPYHMHSNKDPEGFNMFLEYPFHELLMLEPKKYPVTEDKIYEDLKRCKENVKKEYNAGRETEKYKTE